MLRLSQFRVDEDERDLFAYSEELFHGSARVELSRLAVETEASWQMNDPRYLERLNRILAIQGCLRRSREYHVPVLIDTTDWEHRVRLRYSHAPGESLPFLDVDFGCSLQVLDHENLISAARIALKDENPENQWWVVDIYVTGFSSNSEGSNSNVNSQIPNIESVHNEFVRSLRERFPNDRRPSDGLIYERIRYYQGRSHGPRNKRAEAHWWAVLESKPRSKKRNKLSAFWKHPSLPQGFDALLPSRALLCDMNIGVLHKLLAMRCPEPILCYLEKIRRTFFELMGNNGDLLSKMDAVTVRTLQSRAPKVSHRDRRFLEKKWENGSLFRYILDDQQRSEIWERLQNIDYPIPTLSTFFKDLHFLEVGRNVMRQLYDPERKVTIDAGVAEQYRTNISMNISFPQSEIRHNLYDLWRFSLQYGFEMTDHKRRVPRKKEDIERASTASLSQRSSDVDRLQLWRHFFWLTSNHGFNIPLARSSQFQRADLPVVTPCDFPENINEDVDLIRRCGTPFTDAIDADRFALSPECLEQPWEARRITAAFVRRSVFFAFFSYLTGGQPNNPRFDADYNNLNTINSLVGRDTAGPMDIVPILPLNPSEHGDGSNLMAQVPFTEQSEPGLSAQVIPPGNGQRFAVSVFLEGASMRVWALPDDEFTFNQFFGGLDRHRFHITLPEGDVGERGKYWDECYDWYKHNPSSILSATFCGEVYQLESAMEWLDEWQTWEVILDWEALRDITNE